MLRLHNGLTTDCLHNAGAAAAAVFSLSHQSTHQHTHTPDVDDLHACEVAIIVTDEALGQHVVGAGVLTIPVLGLSMTIVHAEDARPLCVWDSININNDNDKQWQQRVRGREKDVMS